MTTDTCRWRYNTEHERWDTECDDCCVLWNKEHPERYGFKYCPFCGKAIEWDSEERSQWQS